MDVKAAPNGVATIEDRILRITGYYGYYPGYSSQKSTSRSSVTRCKPGANCPSSHSGISRQLSPLSVTEDSSAPILELQSRGSSGVCGHRVERQNRSGRCLGRQGNLAANCASFPKDSTVWDQFGDSGECSRIFGEDGLTLKLFLKRTAPFSILWTLTNYLYLLALKKLTATDVSALFCCNKAFVFLLSWIVLKDRFMGVRIVAAIMAITGIVMMAYADNFHADSIIGVAFAVGSASTSALYKVLFKMFLGSANFGEAAHFVSTLGFFNLIFISFTPVILYFTKVEHWSSFAALPWGCLCGMAGLWLAFNILVNVGVVLTYPILISIGTVLSVPGNAAVDLLKQEVIFNVVRLAATIIICLGFLLMLLPEEWDEITLRFINSLKEKKSEEHVDDVIDASAHLRGRSRANGTVSIPLA
ncbi:PREDICTED: solute carrier family 35 member F4 [Propithecus coquereli]|uniref:solute carrier family 35 member F4 n=1 Tax=Propithecus coquereli TaxID=379532 RepID=UPI00063F807D|nr:PREDICTED: solute carrier family 35 member F4 [Propithecus coquereli]